MFEYRPDEADLIPLYNRIADKLSKMDIATELNAGLLYRYPIKEMCPSHTFLEALSNKDVSITISSDAHYPDDMGNYADQQIEILRSIGFNEIVSFKQRKKFTHRIETKARAKESMK